MGRRGALVCAVGGVMIVIVPARAQQAPPSPVPVVQVPPAPGSSGDIDPLAPLAPLPDIGVDWPDLAPDATAAPLQVVPTITETRYSWRLEGLDAISSTLLRQRFDEASTLRLGDGKPANAGQLDRRAREDAELLGEEADGHR